MTLRSETQAPLFGVYVHWPYCLSKCPYCDFNSHVSDSVDHQAWRDAYKKELSTFAAMTQGRRVSSIFFGGGTPSLMQPDTVADVIYKIQKLWGITNDCEITLEANPTSIEADKFKAFAQSGINRVSVGIQSLNDDDLKFLGRQHSAAEALRALDIARENFDRYSFDLIYARPEQTPAQWEQELTTALKHANGHMSLYQLTIEKGTPFYLQHKRGEFSIPEDDGAGQLYELTQDIMAAAGMPAYEVSNHARAGLESWHNMTYWLYEDYVGIGPGAHGRITVDGQKQGTRCHRAPDIWMQKVEESGHGAHPFETIEGEGHFNEAFMMGLRLTRGVDLQALAETSGEKWPAHIDEARLEHLVREGFVTFKDNILAPTTAGLQRLNSIQNYLLK